MNEDMGFDSYLEEMYEDRFYADTGLDEDPEPWFDDDEDENEAWYDSDEYDEPPF